MSMAMGVHDRQYFVMLIVSGSMAVFAVQTRHGRDCEACSRGSRVVLCVWEHVRMTLWSKEGVRAYVSLVAFLLRCTGSLI
jgi:hypothetical protein